MSRRLSLIVLLKTFKYFIVSGICRGFVWLRFKSRISYQEGEVIFRDKKVVILGPAVDQSDQLHDYLEKSDVIVLIKNLFDVIPSDFPDFHGKKVIIAHTLRYPDRRRLMMGDLSDRGYFNVLFPLSGGPFEVDLLRFVASGSGVKVFPITRGSYEKISRSISNFIPTIGFATVSMVLGQVPSSLYLHGFSFFQNDGPFHISDYPRSEIPDQHLMDHVKKVGNHAVELEFSEISRRFHAGEFSCSPLLDDLIQQSGVGSNGKKA